MLMSVSVFVADAKQAVWSFDLEDYSHLGILNVRTYVCMRRCEKWWWRSVYTYVHHAMGIIGLVNRPTTALVYYITSTWWEGVWHNAHTKLVLVQENLHQ